MSCEISDAISDIKRRLHAVQCEDSWIGPGDSVWNGEYLLEESSDLFEALEHLLKKAKDEGGQLSTQVEILKLMNEAYKFNESIVIPNAYYDTPSVTSHRKEKADYLRMTADLNVWLLVTGY